MIPYLYVKSNLDLLLLMNSRNFQYVLIIDFNRFMTTKTKCQGKKYYCQYCSIVLECHLKNFLAIKSYKISFTSWTRWIR